MPSFSSSYVARSEEKITSGKEIKRKTVFHEFMSKS